MGRINWNEYEVAILIYGYYLYESGYYSRKLLIEEISDKLRKYAVGIDLDNNKLYRNYNGISMKFGNVEYLFTNGKKGLKNKSKLEVELFNLFVNKRSEFDILLNESKKIYHIFLL